MSGATFSAPTGATTGLQPYNLEPGVKNLVPATVTRSKWASLRRLTRRKRVGQGLVNSGNASMQKDSMMKSTIAAMVAALTKANTDANRLEGAERDELLAKNAAEFEEALAKAADDQIAEAVATQVDELQKSAPQDEMLYKGLGAIGRIASLASLVADRAEAIENGTDYPGQAPGDEDADVPNDEALHYIDGALALLTLALRSAVNDHVGEPDDGDMDKADKNGELGNGQRLILVKSAEAPDDRSKDFLLKTALPPELAAFAIDPAQISQEALVKGMELLSLAGLEEAQLNKLFDQGGGLAKALPDGSPDPNAGGVADDAGAGGDPNAGGEPDDSNPMAVAMRLCAALMIQLDAIDRAIQGEEAGEGDGTAAGAGDGTQASAPDAGANPPPVDQGADDGGSPAATEGDDEAGKKKGNPFAKSSHNSVEIDSLQKQMLEMGAQLNKLLATPEPAKGIVNTAGMSLSKSVDNAGSDGLVITAEEVAENLAKMDPFERATALVKLTHQAGR